MPTLNFPSPDVANPGDKVHTGDVTWVFTDKGFWSSEVGEAGGGASVHYGPTAPDSPSQGDLWYADDSTVEFGGRLYIYTGTEWVDTSLPGGGSGESGGTEVGSLQTVTDNGAVTTNACEFGGGVSVTGGDVVNAVINSDGSATFAGTINGTQMFLEAPGLGANLILTNTETGTDKTVSATFRAGNNVNKAGITAGVWNNNLQHGYLCFQTTLANSLDTRALITAGGDFRVNPDGLLPGSKAAIDLKSDGSANFNSGNLQIREFGDKSVISLRKDGQNQVHFGATDTAGVIGIDYRSSNFTAGTEVIKLNGDTGSATFAGRIESKGSGSSSVFVTRDVTTGNEQGVYLFRGSRNINGGATENVFFINQDGSGSFAGDVQVGGDPAGGANAGCDVRANGSLVIAGNSSGDSAITIYDAGNSSGKISLNADGSVEFAGGSCTVASSGRINIDRAEGQQYCFTTGYDGNTEQAHISGNGAIYSSYGLAVGGPGTTQGAGNAVINADGSAEFASMVSGANITGKNGQDFTPWYIVGSTSSGQQRGQLVIKTSDTSIDDAAAEGGLFRGMAVANDGSESMNCKISRNGTFRNYATDGSVSTHLNAADGSAEFAGLTEHAGGVKVTGGTAGTGSIISNSNNLVFYGSNSDQPAFTAGLSSSTIRYGITSSGVNNDTKNVAFQIYNVQPVTAPATYQNIYSVSLNGLPGPIANFKAFNVDGGQRDNLNATNNYAFFSNINTSTNPGSSAYNFYASGTAPNYFAGKVAVGNIPDDNPANDTTGQGISLRPDGFISALRVNDQALSIGRRGTTGNLVTFFHDGKNVGNIATDGANISVNGQASDYRIKTNIQTLPSAVNLIKTIRPVTFEYTDRNVGQTYRGFIAHELQEAGVTEAVFGSKDATEAIGTLADYDGTVLETEVTEPSAEELTYTEEVEATPYVDAVAATYDEYGTELTAEVPAVEPTYTTVTRTRTWTPSGTRPVYQGVDQTKLIPLLTKALQEVLTKNEDLEARIAALEGA